ncbi:MAG: DUF445 family protein [Microscillaceae bacterium]|jgi:uncharacterized membrane protein YheB (UPF0754 family)|nr:DUF445 family protein [Microscillaceae bacterium]
MGIVNIIAKILAGAVVGYATNYLAIKMLFQEYFKIIFKPWKINFSLGGVIVKERKEFEARISQLVESDVIHHQAIEQELRKPEFEAALNQLIANLFFEKLPSAVAENLQIGQIPQIEASFEQLRQTFVQRLGEPAQKILTRILANESLKEAISVGQIEKVAHNLTNILFEFLNEDNEVNQLIIRLLDDLSQQKISDLIPQPIAQKMSENLLALTHDLHRVLEFSYYLPMDDLIQKTRQTLDSEALVAQIAEQLADKKLHEFFTAENVDNVPRQITQQIQNLFNSEVSGDIIQTLLKFLLNVLKEEKATVFELLSHDLKANFEHFLQAQLPDLLQTLIPWLRQKKAKLEHLIQEAFEENTSVIGQIVVALFIGNIGKYVGIEEKLIDLIEKQDTSELAYRATDFALNYLKTNTIGEIVQKLNQEKILATLTPVLHENIQSSVQNFQLLNLSDLLDKPIKTWFSVDKLSQSLTELLDNVIEKQLKENWLYTQKFTDFIELQLQKSLDRLQDAELNRWLNADSNPKIAQDLHKWLLEFLPKNRATIESYLFETLQKYWQENPLSQLLNQNPDTPITQNPTWLIEALDDFLKNQFANLKTQNLRDYIDKLNDIPNLDRQISQALRSYVLENLPQLTQGRVENLVQENLAKQGDIQLRAMVYKAMGEELEPLSLFGGVLGAITGAMLLVMPEYQTVGMMLLVSGLAYGITGWGTNWLAIKMLFRPYNAIKFPFFKFNVPFTPGVVAKNKGRFAKSMGRFLGDKLLNQENLQDSFARNQPKMQTGLQAMLAGDNYAFLQKILAENQTKIAQQITTALDKYLTDNQELIPQRLQKLLQENQAWQLGNLNTEKWENSLQNFLQSEKLKTQIGDFVSREILKLTQNKQTLREILTFDFLENLPTQLAKLLQKELQKLEGELTIENILKLINWQNLEKRVDDWLDNNLEEILNAEQEEQFKDQIFVFLRDKLQSEEIKAKIFEFLNKRLNSELAPNQKIRDILGGRLLELIESNLSQILQRVIQLGMEWLKKNKEKIANQIYDDAYEQNALVWTYRNSIFNTSYHLIEEGIPTFFNKEFASLQTAIKLKINDLGETSLSAMEIPALNAESLRERIDQILQNPQLIRKTRQLTNLLLEERIFKIRLNTLIADDAKTLLEHLQELLNPEISLITKHLRQQIQDDTKTYYLSQAFGEVLNSLAHRNLFSVQVATLFQRIEDPDLIQFSQKIGAFLTQSSAFAQGQSELVKQGFNYLKNSRLDELLDIATLSEDLGKALQSILAEPEFRQTFQAELTDFFAQNLANLNENLHPETKDFVVKTASEAIFGALAHNILSLINTLDFKGIVEREIAAMHAKELEDLFYGFARRYFTYLIGYGFIFGIIFGWAIDFGILGLFLLLRK